MILVQRLDTHVRYRCKTEAGALAIELWLDTENVEHRRLDPSVGLRQREEASRP